MENLEGKRRIVDISYRHRLSHLGSCLSAVDIISSIYQCKRPDEKFVLSSGHAGVALYVVLEQRGGRDAEAIFNHHGVHPDRCAECGIDCSTGSLGQGLPIALGMALANRYRNVYCLVSDGECAEGSIWESLNVMGKYEVNNLKLHVNLNGYGAYDPINEEKLARRLLAFGVGITIHNTTVEQLPFLKGLGAHYRVMDEKDYIVAMEVLNGNTNT